MSNASDQAPEKRLSSQTAADLAAGWQRLIGPAIAVNIALFVYVLFEPLLVTRVAFLSRNEIVLARVVYDLYHADAVLFLVVLLFGIVAPGAKLLLFAYAWYFLDGHQTKRLNVWLTILSKAAMTEIMLIALGIVVLRGIGWGSVEIKPGLYFYVAMVLSSFLLSLLVDHQLAASPRDNSTSGRETS